MKTTDRLNELLVHVPKEAQSTVVSLLRQLAHDLNGPLATFMMEGHMLQRKHARMSAIMGEQDLRALSEQLEQLGATIENVQAATQSAANYVQFLEKMGNATTWRDATCGDVRDTAKESP